MSGFLSYIFGTGGTAQTALNNMGFLVAAFILLFVIMYLVGKNVTAENIVFIVLAFLLIVISYGLFEIPIEYIILIIMFIGLFVSLYAYYFFNKPD